MAEKRAFVFDTNFIIQNRELDKTLEKIKDKYNVYITQISIDERIAQQCRELKKNYDEAKKCSSKFSFFATIKFKMTYEDSKEELQKGVQTKYEQCFENCVIPFAKTGETLDKVLIRANQKLPPFSPDNDSSDKGFKDCLLWLSLLDYFKDNGEDEIVFMTDDKGFSRNGESLCDEFKSITGKTIEIKSNGSFKDLIPQEPAVTTDVPKPFSYPDFESIRDEIQEIVDGLRWVPCEDFWGNINVEQTCRINKLVDAQYMCAVFEKLEDTMYSNILNKSIPASEVLELDDRVIDNIEIPMSSIEKCLKLYKKILEQYPDYVHQFYKASASIINQSFVAPTTKSNDVDDDYPF